MKTEYTERHLELAHIAIKATMCIAAVFPGLAVALIAWVGDLPLLEAVALFALLVFSVAMVRAVQNAGRDFLVHVRRKVDQQKIAADLVDKVGDLVGKFGRTVDARAKLQQLTMSMEARKDVPDPGVYYVLEPQRGYLITAQHSPAGLELFRYSRTPGGTGTPEEMAYQIPKHGLAFFYGPLTPAQEATVVTCLAKIGVSEPD